MVRPFETMLTPFPSELVAQSAPVDDSVSCTGVLGMKGILRVLSLCLVVCHNTLDN